MYVSDGQDYWAKSFPAAIKQSMSIISLSLMNRKHKGGLNHEVIMTSHNFTLHSVKESVSPWTSPVPAEAYDSAFAGGSSSHSLCAAPCRI